VSYREGRDAGHFVCIRMYKDIEWVCVGRNEPAAAVDVDRNWGKDLGHPQAAGKVSWGRSAVRTLVSFRLSPYA
jgi:hypothetical protein